MESHLKEEFIQVLKVEKGNDTINFPTADLLLRTGDKLVVYGKVKSIKDVVMGGD
jgi:Trk K+ transport system NAD-binding subunit